MNIDTFGFYFEKAGRSASQGAINPAEEHFEGSTAEEAVVRETGQNSIDASNGLGPVRMTFEIASMSTADIPGIERLREHLDSVAAETSGQSGHDRMRRAAELAREDEIMVLRISDQNTRGLGGTEKIADSKSPLSALTRGAGNSDDDGGRGGSFGIGSAVGPMASDLSTVLYTSLTADTDRTVFAAYSRLASHPDSEGVMRSGDGFFTKLDSEDFEYLRPAPSIGPFAARTEPGTDTYILGFRMAGDDPRLLGIRRAAIDNFMLAIHLGELEVVGISPADQWTLNVDTLEGFARERTDSMAFYRAITDPVPTVKNSALLGQISLYVSIDDTLERSLHTITMRRPHMRIGEFRHTSISTKYAAVLVCDDEKGNALLRGLEPPQHDKWDPGRDSGRGQSAIKELKEFVRETLRERVKSEIGDTVQIRGLARFLPLEGIETGDDGEVSLPGARGRAGDREASKVVGDPAPASTRHEVRRTAAVGVRRPASGGQPGGPIRKGKDRGGSSQRQGSETKLPGTGNEGNGASRILAGDLRFRSWTADGDDDMTLVTLALTPTADVSGDLKLAPLGPGGSPENGYTLPIAEARLHTEEGTATIDFNGNTLENLELAGGKTVRIDILVPKGSRYRLGVD